MINRNMISVRINKYCFIQFTCVLITFIQIKLAIFFVKILDSPES